MFDTDVLGVLNDVLNDGLNVRMPWVAGDLISGSGS